MALRTLFDQNRRKDIQRALEKGEPLPFQRNQPGALAEGIESDVIAFIRDIQGSSESTRQNLERAQKFRSKRIEETLTTHSGNELKDADASARDKLQLAAAGAIVTYTPAEQVIVDLLELNKLINLLEKRVKAEDGVKELIGGKAGSGRVGP